MPLPPITLVTGASSNHFLCLQSLLWTIAKFEPRAHVIVYDLGLTAAEHAFLRDTPPFSHAHWELRTFDFSQHPPHFNMSAEAGRMAFRPTALAQAARTTRDADSTILLWLDAGCQLREPLAEIRAGIRQAGIYCPCAPGTIANCLHPAARGPLAVTDDLLPEPIRDAGVCGFDLTQPPVRALLDRWAEVARDEHCTAPSGSTRRNHRQDAVFAVLLNQAARANGWIVPGNRARGVAIKQDTLTLAETQFRILGKPR